MPKIEPRTLQGFFDYLPAEMALRRNTEDKIRQVFKSFGYPEINTPSIEYADILFGKYGEEEKLIYHFNDHGDRHVALRYDQTVPLARFIAEHKSELTFPFKRFEIGRVWRADAARKARKREFIQCDVDIIGTDSLYSDAEIIMVTMKVMKNLGLNNTMAHINNRKILSGIFTKLELTAEQIKEVLRSVDKFDKIGLSGVLKDLEERCNAKKINFEKIKETIEVLFALENKTFEEIKIILENYLIDKTGIEEIEEIFMILKNYGLNENVDYRFDLSLVRGLDYYTGMVFEVRSTDFSGSFAGGGRYADLCGMYSNDELSGTGVGIGFEPICSYLAEKKIELSQSKKVLVTIFGKELLKSSLEIAQKLREQGILVEVYPDPTDKIGKQFKYADNNKINLAIIIGEDEAKNNMYKLKDLSSGKQEDLNEKDLIKKLSEI